MTMTIFGLELTLWQAVTAGLGAFILGFSKTGIIGIGIVLTPLLASGFGAGPALGFVVPLSLLGDIVAIVRYRQKVSMGPLVKALPWGVLGTLAGWRLAAAIAAAYGTGAEPVLRRLIGILMAVVVALGWYVARHPALALGPAGGRGKVRTWYAACLGTFAGLVSMLTNSGGPIWGVYLASLNLEVKEIIGTVVWCYLVVSALKIPLSASLGFLTADTLRLNALLAPLLVAGVLFGGVVSGRLDKRHFGGIVRVLAAAGSLYMIFL
ncbi:MAG: sulfite exporter TauE/SafE family protein [Planctomycetes bacterium]|nr:sulfite exporter TauE/SafE family protein [Planctomycetota bacterium]